MKRLNKEYQLNVCDEISLKCGTVNKDDPQVIYINGRCWIYPTYEFDYKRVISNVESKMRSNIMKFVIGDKFDKKVILDFDISTDGFKPGVKKFLSFDFYIRQLKDKVLPLKEIKDKISFGIETISNYLVLDLNENGFCVNISK